MSVKPKALKDAIPAYEWRDRKDYSKKVILEKAELDEFIVRKSTITCINCGNQNTETNDHFDDLETFYDLIGYRVVNGKCLCPKCVKLC